MVNSKRGGKREGAGRPVGRGKYGEPTQSIRVPVSRVDEVKDFLNVSVAAFRASERKTCPLYSSKVPAGFPSPGEDHVERYLDLNDQLIKHPSSTFFVTASGDSMTDAGIQSGDMLIVDRSLEATHGKIVIAAINGELTVKRLSKIDNKLQLLPANPQYKPIDITENHELVIWGVVTHVVHTPE